MKESAPRLLVQSVRQVASGEQSWNGKAIAGALRLVLQREQAVAAASSTLTPRELEVMRMVAAGLRNKEIGARLDITEGTVKFHLHGIYEKLQIDGRYALISTRAITDWPDEDRRGAWLLRRPSLGGLKPPLLDFREPAPHSCEIPARCRELVAGLCELSAETREVSADAL